MKREIYLYHRPGCSDIIQIIPYSSINPIGWDWATFLCGTSQHRSRPFQTSSKLPTAWSWDKRKTFLYGSTQKCLFPRTLLSHLLSGLKRLLQALIKWEGHNATRLVLQKENCPGDTQGISQFYSLPCFGRTGVKVQGLYFCWDYSQQSVLIWLASLHLGS